MVGQWPFELRRGARKTIELYNQLTGLNFRLVEREDRYARIWMFRGSRAHIRKQLRRKAIRGTLVHIYRRKSRCVAFLGATGGVMDYATIAISSEAGFATSKFCILHEMGHTLGLLGHSPHDKASAFYIYAPDDEANATLSINDMIVIRALYDRRLYPGMPRTAVMRTVRFLIPKLAKAVAVQGPSALYQRR